MPAAVQHSEHALDASERDSSSSSPRVCNATTTSTRLPKPLSHVERPPSGLVVRSAMRKEEARPRHCRKAAWLTNGAGVSLVLGVGGLASLKTSRIKAL